MKKTDLLRLIEQMFRDKRPQNEIADFVARQREIAEAEEEASAQNAQSPLTSEHRRVLELLSLTGDYCKQQMVAQKLGIAVDRAVWLLEFLQERGYAVYGQHESYRIEQKGRNFLYDTSA